MYPSSDDVTNIEEITFDEEAKIALFSAKTYKINGTIKITRKVQTPFALLFDTGADPNQISKSTEPPSCRNRIQYQNVLLSQIASKKRLQLEEAMLLLI